MGSIIRICAIAAASIVGLGLLTFTVDRSQEGSDTQVRAVDGRDQPVSDTAIDRPAPPPDVERRRERKHSELRELIDDGNDYLLAPFAFVNSDNVWVQRLVPGLLGLLAYGFGGLLLANLMPKHRPEHHDWREATP